MISLRMSIWVLPFRKVLACTKDSGAVADRLCGNVYPSP